MKKLFTYLLVFTFASILTACNILPAPQGNEPVKQEDSKENEDTNKENEETKKDEEVNKDKDSSKNNDKDKDKVNTKTEDDDLAVAFQNYLDEIMLLANEEVRIIDAYGSVSGTNYVNDSIMYEALYYEVVPSYTEFVRALEEIDSNNEVIRDLHAIYVEAATIQLGAFTVMISALEEQSTDLVELANQGLTEASALISDWQAQVQVLSVQTGVSF